MAIVKIQLPFTLHECPIWWNEFMKSIDTNYSYLDDVSPVIKCILDREYAATIYEVATGYVLEFGNKSAHLMFMMKYA